MIDSLGNVQKLINDFSEVKRSLYVAGKDEWGNDVLHSMSVAFLAWRIYDILALDIDLEKILKYAMIHDLVEIYAGDVNAYADPAAREKKKRSEAASLKRIAKDMAGDFPDLAPLIQHYEDKDDEESLFVWSVDKIQALVQSKLDNYHAYYSQGVTSDEARRVQGSNIARAHPKVAPFYREVFEQFMNDYDDTAVKKDGEVITHNRASRT